MSRNLTADSKLPWTRPTVRPDQQNFRPNSAKTVNTHFGRVLTQGLIEHTSGNRVCGLRIPDSAAFVCFHELRLSCVLSSVHSRVLKLLSILLITVMRIS